MKLLSTFPPMEKILLIIFSISCLCIHAQHMEQFSSIDEKNAYDAYIKDTTKPRYHIGQLYGGGIIINAYFDESHNGHEVTLTPHGLIISLTDVGEPNIWDTSAVKSYHAGGFNDWILPTSDLINRLHYYNFRLVNLILDSLGTPIKKGNGYWCVDQQSTNPMAFSYSLQTTGIQTGWDAITNKFRVRAFRKF